MSLEIAHAAPFYFSYITTFYYMQLDRLDLSSKLT